jgi:hypothetical protein
MPNTSESLALLEAASHKQIVTDASLQNIRACFGLESTHGGNDSTVCACSLKSWLVYQHAAPLLAACCSATAAAVHHPPHPVLSTDLRYCSPLHRGQVKMDLVPTMLKGHEAKAQPGMSPPHAGAAGAGLVCSN